MAINVLQDDYLKREEFRLLIRLENDSIFYGKEGRLDGGLGGYATSKQANFTFARCLSGLHIFWHELKWPQNVILAWLFGGKGPERSDRISGAMPQNDMKKKLDPLGLTFIQDMQCSRLPEINRGVYTCFFVIETLGQCPRTT